MGLVDKPNVDDPASVVFTNLMIMIHKREHTSESANRFMDELGLDPNKRFWGVGSKVDPKSGRLNVVYFNWRNGGWVNAQRELQKMIRDDIMEGRK